MVCLAVKFTHVLTFGSCLCLNYRMVTVMGRRKLDNPPPGSGQNVINLFPFYNFSFLIFFKYRENRCLAIYLPQLYQTPRIKIKFKVQRAPQQPWGKKIFKFILVKGNLNISETEEKIKWVFCVKNKRFQMCYIVNNV